MLDCVSLFFAEWNHDTILQNVGTCNNFENVNEMQQANPGVGSLCLTLYRKILLPGSLRSMSNSIVAQSSSLTSICLSELMCVTNYSRN